MVSLAELAWVEGHGTDFEIGKHDVSMLSRKGGKKAFRNGGKASASQGAHTHTHSH